MNKEDQQTDARAKQRPDGITPEQRAYLDRRGEAFDQRHLAITDFNAYCFGYSDGYVAARTETPPDKWVDVNENGLPQEMGEHLFYELEMGFVAAYFSPGVGDYSWATHWRKITPPSKEQGGSGGRAKKERVE